LLKENIKNVVDAIKLNLRIINILAKIKPVKTVFIAYVKVVETRKKLNIGQKFQIKVSYLLYFNEKEEFLCLVMANNIIAKNVIEQWRPNSFILQTIWRNILMTANFLCAKNV
jgi:hypothetical protein